MKEIISKKKFVSMQTDLQNQLDNVVNKSDILNVYTNLKDASNNHFIAFTNNLTSFNCIQKYK